MSVFGHCPQLFGLREPRWREADEFGDQLTSFWLRVLARFFCCYCVLGSIFICG
ncbi:MAG: hypothetical protein LBK06_05020 [Planctomycetaceae bacterium]|nr:hypothetical protein [Planctomycetaceae bacterium]